MRVQRSRVILLYALTYAYPPVIRPWRTHTAKVAADRNTPFGNEDGEPEVHEYMVKMQVDESCIPVRFVFYN